MELDDSIKAMNEELTSFIAKSNEEAQAHGKLGRENKEALARLEERSGEISARVLELEQKATSMVGGVERVKSLGEQFAESDSYKGFASGISQKAHFEGVQANTTTGSDTTVAPQRNAEIISLASRSLRIADVIPAGTTSSNAVEYTKEATFTNNAAETAEAGAKPESDITFSLVSAPVRTIATWLKVSKQVRDDAPMLVSYIDTRLAYMVDYRYDNQLLNGDGTGVNLSGLLDTGNYTAFTPTGTDKLVSIRQAITDCEQADYSPTAVILNPGDVEAIELTTTTDGIYVFGDPGAGRMPMVWGLPIVSTNAMTAGQFILGAMSMASQRWERQGTVVEMFEQDDTNVQSNLITIRAERRAALAIYRPASLIGGALSL